MPELVSQLVRVGDYSVATTSTAVGRDDGPDDGPDYGRDDSVSPRVVFVHGWAGTRALWNQTLLALAPGHGSGPGADTNWHPVAIDLPGFGPMGLDYAYGFQREAANGVPDPGWQLHFRFGNFGR